MTIEPIEILLVEDNPDDVELTLRALRKRNIANLVKVVSDGAEALEYLLAADPHVARIVRPKLVLLDLKLPRVSGIEVLARLKASESARTIPVVVLTSSREESDLAECYRLGVNSYIVKPVDFEQFTKVVYDLGLYWLLLNTLPDSLRRTSEH